MSNRRFKKRAVETEEPTQVEELTPVSEPTDIMPHPVPVSFRVSQINDGQGGSAVQLEVFTPTGRQVVYIAPQVAVSLAEALQRMGATV